ncbi:hypothetical protein KI387_009990, partial [Taxus chinensis]
MSVLFRIQLPFTAPGQRFIPVNPTVIRASKPAKYNSSFQGLYKNETRRDMIGVRRAWEKMAVRRLPLVSIKCVMTAGTAIAAAATSGYLHAAVTSTITNVAITAVAIASGACLSTKIDCLWPRGEKKPGINYLYPINLAFKIDTGKIL